MLFSIKIAGKIKVCSILLLTLHQTPKCMPRIGVQMVSSAQLHKPHNVGTDNP